MVDGSEEWYVGQRVFVPRITDDPSVIVKISDFLGDEDEENPDVRLLVQEYRNVAGSAIKQELVRQCFRYCKLAELQDTPRKATRGGSVARRLRNLEAVHCLCGCGQETSGSRFRQGHDAKLKSRLLKTARGEIEGDSAAAVAQLTELGWEKYLTKE